MRKRLICGKCCFNPYPFTVCLTRKMMRKMREAGWRFPRRFGSILCPECAREAEWRRHDRKIDYGQKARMEA